MNLKQILASLIGGTVFGGGLALSGMTKPEIVLDFLNLRDLGLLLVMAGAIVAAGTIYHLAPRIMKKPLLASSFNKYTNKISKKTIIGSAIFGIGWGISGVCPGAGIASIGIGNWPIFFALGGIFVGAYIQGKYFSS